ncbi:MAG: amino acid permease [Oscillospiraceae bacterium]|nr:amino acid permease [Oscillospiraceae bacterium]
MSNKQNKSSGSKLRKELGLFSGVSLVAGMTIGSGIYYLGSYVLERTNMSMGMALVCWLVGGLISIMGGLCFAELGAEMPVTGGLTTYLAKAYHPMLGFINGFAGFLLICSGSIAALAIAAVTQFAEIFNFSDLTVKILAIAIILIFTGLNLRGVKFGAAFQNFSMVVRVIPLVLVIVVGVFFGTQSPNLSPATAFGGEPASFIDSVKLISFATFASLWAYEGWTNLNTVAGEMKKPRRDIPLAIIISMGGITLIYTLFNLAIYRIIPANEVNSLIAGGNLYLGTEAVGRILGGVGKWVVLVGMFIGIIGTVNGDCLVFPRTYYAMAKGGFFFKSMGELNDKGVPANATLASSAMAIILVCFNSLQSLTDWLITVSALINLLAIIAVLVFRFRFPDMERPYKVWGGVPVIILTAICFMVLLVNNFVEDPATSLKGLIIIAICVPMYFVFRKMNGGKEYDTDLIDN